MTNPKRTINVQTESWAIDIPATMNNVPIFQEPAVCLTKFGPESGETASAILALADPVPHAKFGSSVNHIELSAMYPIRRQLDSAAATAFPCAVA